MSGGTPGVDTGPAGSSDPRVGQRIGSYRLVRLIGEGATGRVFEVEHLSIGRRAAMKILAPDHAARPGAIKRLFAEAQAVSRISHPHIVEVNDYVEAEQTGGANAIVMELLEGQSLGQAIADGKGMPPERFIPILSQVADALAAAHAARVVHRDLKPENIFLVNAGGQPDQVKLLDFGLAKTLTEAFDPEATIIDSAYMPTHGTAEGVFVGTPAYASPEQLAGKAVDHRTDIYSFGVILYELLCGKLPFEGRNFGEYIIKHLTQDPPAASPAMLRTPLRRTVDAVARRCLAKDPADRFASAAELRAVFDRLAAGETHFPGIIPSPPPGLLATPISRRAAAAALGVFLIAGAVTLLLRAPAKRPATVSSALPATSSGPSRPQIIPLPSPERVELDFVTVPPGAEIRRAGDPRPLGITPAHLSEPASGQTVAYELRLPGYVVYWQEVVLAPTADLAVRTVGGQLHRLGARGKGRGAGERGDKKPGRNDTIDPFSR